LFAVPFTPATGGRVLVAEGEDREAITRAIAGAARTWVGEESLSSAHVLFPRRDEAAMWRSAGYAERYGVQFHWQRNGDRSWEEFLARFNSKRRNQLKREVAQPAKDGVTIETLTADALTPAVVRTMFQLYAVNVDKHFYGRRYLNARFFELVAERFAAWRGSSRGRTERSSQAHSTCGRATCSTDVTGGLGWSCRSSTSTSATTTASATPSSKGSTCSSPEQEGITRECAVSYRR
jgi:hypothetical protein